jgi:hypothetical protein
MFILAIICMDETGLAYHISHHVPDIPFNSISEVIQTLGLEATCNAHYDYYEVLQNINFHYIYFGLCRVLLPSCSLQPRSQILRSIQS